jgi:putative selenate reductase molybdopterin-binding subunit
VYFAETADVLGPLGSKPMSESPFTPVAPALANAVRDAIGIRFDTLSLARDRICLAIAADRGTRVAASAGSAPGPTTAPTIWRTPV